MINDTFTFGEMSDKNHDDSQPSVSFFPSREALALSAAERFVSVCAEAVATRGRCSVALGGGTTYWQMYALLAERKDIDWSSIHLFIGDERFVPRDDPLSNWGAMKKVFLDNVSLPRENVHPMRTEGVTIEEAAREYEEEIAVFFHAQTQEKKRSRVNAAAGEDLISNFQFSIPSGRRGQAFNFQFDLVLLGMGPDGHTLSIFPGSEESRNPSDHLVIPIYDSPKTPARRITLTYRAVNQARHILFVVSGVEKKEAVEAILREKRDIVKWPAQGVRPEEGEVEWMVAEFV